MRSVDPLVRPRIVSPIMFEWQKFRLYPDRNPLRKSSVPSMKRKIRFRTSDSGIDTASAYIPLFIFNCTRLKKPVIETSLSADHLVVMVKSQPHKRVTAAWSIEIQKMFLWGQRINHRSGADIFGNRFGSIHPRFKRISSVEQVDDGQYIGRMKFAAVINISAVCSRHGNGASI